jgi:hypothetical protein
MGLISPQSPDHAAPDGTLFSDGFRVLPAIAVIAGFLRPVPKWAIFTPGAALIFINHSTEKLGVL